MVAGVVILAGLVGWFIFSPGKQENQLTSGTPLVQVAVPALDALALEGEALFNANCARCHGVNAAGNDGSGPPFVHLIYEPNHHGDAAFFRAATNGVRAHHWRFGNMPPVPKVSQDDITKIVAYVRTIQRANGIN